ncbi:MAG: sll0787 family AIR synthase-like protein [Cyanobacteria bacterium P01_D01_bin.1]
METLSEIISFLQSSPSILGKRDIQTAAATVGQYVRGADGSQIRIGDDCAAIPDGKGYLLFAAEGIWPQLVARDPWFAGWCAVMVNLSDIAAMGGSAIAIVDTLWSVSVEGSQQVWAGMQAAAAAYGVPIVGGHTNCHSDYDGLAVAVLGRAEQLITSFDAKPGEALMMAVDMAGNYHGDYAFWDAATAAEWGALRSHLSKLEELANLELCSAGKDISMGGLAGTLLMLCEASGCGALLNLNKVPRPDGVKWTKWLTSFPSYGFLFSVPVKNVAAVEQLLVIDGVVCQMVGEVRLGTSVALQLGDEQRLFWDLVQSPLTGFGASAGIGFGADSGFVETDLGGHSLCLA